MFRLFYRRLIIAALNAAPCGGAFAGAGARGHSSGRSRGTRGRAPRRSTASQPRRQVDARAYILVDYRTDKTLAAKERRSAHGASQPHEADDGLYRFPGIGGRQTQVG